SAVDELHRTGGRARLDVGRHRGVELHVAPDGRRVRGRAQRGRGRLVELVGTGVAPRARPGRTSLVLGRTAGRFAGADGRAGVGDPHRRRRTAVVGQSRQPQRGGGRRGTRADRRAVGGDIAGAGDGARAGEPLAGDDRVADVERRTRRFHGGRSGRTGEGRVEDRRRAGKAVGHVATPNS